MGKDFRYYFQHPWSRLIVAYLVIFFNFLIFAEDPVSHSQTEANVIVVGNCFSFVTNKYPRGVGWRILKVLLWLLAILIGLIAGKFLFHQRLFGKYPWNIRLLMIEFYSSRESPIISKCQFTMHFSVPSSLNLPCAVVARFCHCSLSNAVLSCGLRKINMMYN